MLRKIGLLGILSLLVAAAPARAEETFTIKLKKGDKGAVTQHTKEETVSSHTKVEGPDGTVITDQKESKTTIEQYEEILLAKEKGKRPTKIRREYSKATVTNNGTEKTLPFDGKTLRIEKKGGKYHFTLDSGEELKGKDVESLDRSFNKPGGEDVEELVEKAILPKKPVAVGQTWKIDADELIEDLWKGNEHLFTLDTSKAAAQGKLLRVYKKDGRQYGVFDINVTLPITGDLSVDKYQKAPIQEGSKLAFRIQVDGCIDGISSDGIMDSSINFDLVVLFQIPDGQECKLTTHGSQKSKETSKEKAGRSASAR